MMKNLTDKEIDKMLADHSEWLKTRHCKPKLQRGKRADFSNCEFMRYDFDTKNLAYAIFKNACLGCCSFCDCDLSFADFRGAILAYADMRRCNLRYADLSCTNLSGSDLTNARLQGAILTGTNLSYVNLLHAEVSDIGAASPFVYDAIAAHCKAMCALRKTDVEWYEVKKKMEAEQ